MNDESVVLYRYVKKLAFRLGVFFSDCGCRIETDAKWRKELGFWCRNTKMRWERYRVYYASMRGAD